LHIIYFNDIPTMSSLTNQEAQLNLHCSPLILGFQINTHTHTQNPRYLLEDSQRNISPKFAFKYFISFKEEEFFTDPMLYLCCGASHL